MTNADGTKFIEQVKPKTFQRALEKNDDTPILFNHNENRVLGSTKSGAKLYEDNIGLRCILETNDAEIRQKAENNELTGWSFGFKKIADEWQDGEIQKRILEDIKLVEVSLLDKTPAYIATSVEMRGEEISVLERRVFEDDNVRVRKTETVSKTQEETQDGIWELETVRQEIEIYKLKNKGELY
jgi:phage prohead protease, HK97 family|nr:MAG TPA: prohead serine protease [Caudoviricetes sp.]